MIKVAICIFMLFLGGWLTYDGARALIMGDYTTPKTGPHAGQLGPWSAVLAAVGVQPRSTFVKCFHVALGLAWLGSDVWFLAGARNASMAVVACAVLTLWYVPMGTLISLLVLALIFAMHLRAS